MPKKEYDYEFANFEQILAKIKEEYEKQKCKQLGINFEQFRATTFSLIRNKLAAGERFEDINLAGYELEEKKNKKKTKTNEEPIRTSLYIDEEKKMIAEQIYDNGISMFCVYNGNSEETITYEDEINDGYVAYQPINDEEVSKKAILLPSKAEEYGTDEELDIELKNYINEWLDIPEDICQFAVWNVKRSWVYERFHTLNYLRALGDTGQGKSRFLDTLGYIHYKPIATSGATTAAPVFRIINKWKGTLIMDEADFQKSDEAQDIIKIINQGYEKGRFVMRCDKENHNKVEFFDPYCPKILATRKTFYDKAVESRCITQVMTGTIRRNIKWNLNDNFWKQTLTLRNKLLMWRFRNYFKIDPLKEIEFNDDLLEPRVQQIVGSFIGLFCNSEEQLTKFKEFIRKYQENLIDERQSSFDGEIVIAIHNLVEEGNLNISSNDIIEKASLNGLDGKILKARALTSHLKTLGFEKSIPKRVEDRIKRCIPLNQEHLNQLFKRYGVTVVTMYKDTPKEVQIELIEESGCIPNNRNNRNTVTENILEIIKHLQEKLDIVPTENVVKIALNLPNLNESLIEQAITNLLGDGSIFEPKSGFLKVL